MGGGFIAALPLAQAAANDIAEVEIKMLGRADGSHVWFDPVGLRIRPGQTVRWINLDPGNSHTTTAYHPANFDRPRRMPHDADPWDSGYLLPNEAFAVTLLRPGVYDYYCQPHEHAGMVGRIVAGEPHADRAVAPAGAAGDPRLPQVAVNAFPSIADIMRKGVVRRD